ncbi:ATP-binding protein [Spirillospora sp. CA-255316]
MTALGDRAVEVLYRGGDGRWTVGSGYLVGGRLVVTAAHNVTAAHDVTAAREARAGGRADGEVLVRRLNGGELPAEILAADAADDIALLQVAGVPPPADLPPVRFARIDRTKTDLITRCWAIGYPRWKEHPREPGTAPLRDSVQIEGVIPPASNLRRGLLELRTTSTPRPLSARSLNESEWQGMSGAVVFSDHPAHGPLAVGVVIEHHLPEGSSALTVAPLTRLAALVEAQDPARRWQLGLDDWVVLPSEDPPAHRPPAAAAGHLALRRPLSDFTDREEAIARVRALLTDRLAETAPVVVLYGMGGVGKTALANQIAHRLGTTFGHARILVDLGGGGGPEVSPDAAVVQALQGFGLFDDEMPHDPRQRRYTLQRLLRAGPSLLVLDNVSRAAQVLPLLPESPGSAAILTSRSALTSVEGADRLPVDPLPDPEGLRLFERIVGTERVAREREAGRTLVSLLGGLPLAIRIAAANASSPAMRQRSLTSHAERLADEQARMSELDGEDKSVRSSFETSYRALRPDTARLFRHLGLLVGADFVPPLVARTAGTDPEHADRLLGELADRQLVEVAGSAGDRFRLHDLLRLYAREQAEREESPDDRRAAFRRSVQWYADELDAWMSLPGAHERPPAEAIAWFADESLNVLANVRSASERRERDLVVRVCGSLYGLLFHRGLWDEMEATKSMAVEAARELRDGAAELGSLIHLAEARRILGRREETVPLYERALEIARGRDDDDKVGWILTHYGDLQCDLGRPDEALRRYAEAGALYRQRGDKGAEIWLSAHIADAYRHLGQPEDAVRVLTEARADSRALGDREGIIWCEWHLAVAYDQMGRYAEAEEALAGPLADHRAAGDQAGLATMLTILGEIHLHAGRPAQAREALTEALELVRAIDAPRRVAEIQAVLERVGD